MINKVFVPLLSGCLTLLSLALQGQSYKSNIDNLNPVSPTAYQFLKYDQMPVSEYTGIPDISIPLYEIAEDDIKVPLALSYHAVGIRVNQDASWVGLGWDLQIGSVVQTINDVDDFGYDSTARREYRKMLPDFHGSPIPSEFPMRYTYPSTSNGAGWSNPYPINDPSVMHSYKIATDYYVPINGDFNVRDELLFTDNTTDSEPDIFKANFLGHALSFIVDFKTKKIVVLNKKGYSVKTYNDGWQIITPAGEEFYFEEKSVVKTLTGSDSFDGWTSTGYDPSAKIWMLTKIVSKNRRQILFNYTKTGVFDSYPKYSEKYQKATLISNEMTTIGHGGVFMRGYLGLELINIHDPIMKSQSRSRESYVYLSSIVFPKGQINFVVSDRNDMIGAKKLDSISVVTGSQNVKAYKFNYGYFISSETMGNGVEPFNPSLDGNTASYRLKLLNVKENNELTHSFKYNNTPLPKKNSFAQDLWGFYNGQLSNTSLIPNPVRYNKPELGNNGNNNSANLVYTKACILEEVRYPTGGRVVFDYELNKFNNYWVPDFNSTTNQITSGNGLRIKSINHIDSGDSILKRVIYTYSDGKSILPIDLFRSYRVKRNIITTDYVVTYTYNIDEVNGNGYFSPSLFGSINAVGYSIVTKEEVSEDGTKNGRTVTYFHNNTDVATNSIGSFSQLSATLPAYKQMASPLNGSVNSIMHYNNNNQLLRKEERKYKNNYSDIYYGARIFGYTNYIYEMCLGDCEAMYIAQKLIGYYPIYDFETLLDSTIVKEYSNGDSLTTIGTNSYDQYNQLKQASKNNSDNSLDRVEYMYPYDYTGTAILDTMTRRNRISDVVSFMKYRKLGTSDRLVYKYERQFRLSNGKIVESKAIVNMNPFSPDSIPDEYLYEDYDQQYTNLVQYKVKGITNSFIWDYDGQYVVAEVLNASNSSVAYSSFESSGKGNWSYSGPTILDNSSPTGLRCYNLNNGAISTTKLFDNSATYTITYWTKNTSAYNIPGTKTGYPIKGRSVNGWTYYEHQLTGQSSFSISGTGYIDELRLYPVESNINTYTHKPLIGVTSKSDQMGNVVYYEYDAFSRLKLIKDQNGKITKQCEYQYRMPLTSAPLWESTGSDRCQIGTGGYITGKQEVEEKDINPTSASYNSTRWVDNGLNAACVVVPDWRSTGKTRCVVDAWNSNTGEGEAEQKDMNPYSPSYNTNKWINTGPSPTCPLPPTCAQGRAVNNVCETGTRELVASEMITTHKYECTYWVTYSYGPGETIVVYSSGPCSEN